MPFKALLNGSPFYSEELNEEIRNQNYFCPICEKAFIPVIPKSDITKHFRHKKGGKAHGEPDGPEHRAIKKAVKEGAEALAFKTDYEVRILGDVNRITDVLIETDHISSTLMGYRGFAVECQCASMSIEEFNERNHENKESGLKPIWVLGAKYYNFDRIKKLVTQNIAEFQFCSFFNENRFFFFDGIKVMEIGLQEIILLRSGYSKPAYALIDELKIDLNELKTTIIEKNDAISKLSADVLATRNSELEKELVWRKKKIDRQKKIINSNKEKLIQQAMLNASLNKELSKFKK